MKKPVGGQKWWEIGAAAFLSVSLLGAVETETMKMEMVKWKKK